MKVKIEIKDGFVLGKKLPFINGSLDNQDGTPKYEYVLSVDADSTILHFQLKDCETKKAYHANSDLQDAFKKWLVNTINKIDREKAKNKNTNGQTVVPKSGKGVQGDKKR